MISSRQSSSLPKSTRIRHKRVKKCTKRKENNRINSSIFQFLRPNSTIRGYARVFWFVSCLFSAAICVFQLENRFRLYFSNPTISHVTITQTETGRFPPVTLCPSNMIIDFQYFLREKMVEKYLKLYSLKSSKKNPGASLASIWNLSFDQLNISLPTIWKKYSLDKQFAKYSVPCAALVNKQICGNRSAKSPLTVKSIYTIHGKCYTYILEEDVEYHGAGTNWEFYFGKQKLLKMLLSENIESDIKFLVTNLTPFLAHAVYYAGQELLLHQHTDISINSKEFHFLNLEDRPCRTEDMIFGCRSECLNKKLEQNLNCKLPFINSTTLTPCNDFNSSINAYKTAYLTYITHSNAECKCLPMCKETTYNTLIDVVPSTLESPITTSFTFYFSDNYKELVEEGYLYTFPSLLSDVAGNVGFFLGISVLGILEIIVSVLGYVSKYKIKPQ